MAKTLVLEVRRMVTMGRILKKRRRGADLFRRRIEYHLILEKTVGVAELGCF